MKQVTKTELKQALEDLTDAIDVSRLHIRKDFRLLTTHAYATKLLHRLERK